jgi:ribosomal protein S18 acetylase RimI-like enzyme
MPVIARLLADQQEGRNGSFGAEEVEVAVIEMPSGSIHASRWIASCGACHNRSMDTVEMRVATPDDAVAVEDYHDRCFRKTYSLQLLAGKFDAPGREGTQQQLREWFQSDSEFETRVAIIDSTPIGHFTVRGHQLVHLFVDPDHQGMGLGSRLLAQGEAMIVANGHSDLELHTRVENLAAIAFYKARGWTMTDRLIHTVEHGISYCEHVIIKHLP